MDGFELPGRIAKIAVKREHPFQPGLVCAGGEPVFLHGREPPEDILYKRIVRIQSEFHSTKIRFFYYL